jgi:hypothetical protein
LAESNAGAEFDGRGEAGWSPSQRIALAAAIVVDCEDTLGNEHRATLVARSNLAHRYYDAGQRSRAIALFEATLADCVRVLGASHPDTVTVGNRLLRARLYARDAEPTS